MSIGLMLRTFRMRRLGKRASKSGLTIDELRELLGDRRYSQREGELIVKSYWKQEDKN